MQSAFSAIFERFGRIDGGIHTAGLTGGGLIQLKEIEQLKQTLLPKVQGTEIFYHLLAKTNAGFMACCSSLSALLGV